MEEWSRPLEPELMFWILGIGPPQSESQWVESNIFDTKRL